MTLPLQTGIIYGPVRSRRLGRSLGINLMPTGYKLCSLNCVYCHYGWTKKRTMKVGDCLKDLPCFDDVIYAIEQAARSSTRFEFLTFSGNGEPSLYPGFPELVQEVARIRDRYRPEVKIALLSNSTGLIDRDVRECITRIDFPIFKLDASSEEKFKLINRPAEGVDYAEILGHLSSLEDIYIQTVLIDGTPSNLEKTDILAYYKLLRRIEPKESHIYSIDRPTPDAGITLVPPQKLREIADLGREETGVKIKAFYANRPD